MEWLEAKIVKRRDWTDKLLSFSFEANLADFTAGQFVRLGVDIDGERVSRAYSLVNAPQEPLLEVCFNVVEQGPLTPRLAELQPGDSIWLGPKAAGTMIIDKVPDAHHLWMLSTGTGIGPFLSILKTNEPWQRFERIVIGQSVQYPTELIYRDEIEAIKAARGEQLQYIRTVTREKATDAMNQRFPAAIESGELESLAGITLSPDQSHVMLCGNSAMISDVSDVLGKRGMHRHSRREPGHITTEKYH